MIKILPLFFIISFFFLTRDAYAVSLIITDVPQTITEDPFTITVSIEGAQAGTNYLRVDIYKDGSTDYFGETWNGSDWYRESSHDQYLPVSIVSGQTFTGQIQARAGQPSLGEYDGSGSYKLRVRRYTSSGNYNTTEANSSSVPVSVNIPIANPTPTSSPSPTSNTSTSATSKSPSPAPKKSSSPSPSPKTTPTPNAENNNPEVLGTASADFRPLNSDALTSPSPSPSFYQGAISQQAAPFLIGGGLILVASSIGVFTWYKKIVEQNKIQKGSERFDDEKD